MYSVPSRKIRDKVLETVNNYSPKAKVILLDNLRDFVSGII